MRSVPNPIQKATKEAPFDPQAFLATVGAGRSITHCPKGYKIFSQGDTSDAVFYLQKGRVKLTVTSEQGRQAVIAILGPGDFFGEASLAGNSARSATATTLAPSFILTIEKQEMMRVLHEEHAFSDLFLGYLLSRNTRIEEDLVHQLFDSSERRLARALLLLARYGEEGQPEAIVPAISQETLAAMVGTTRSRVCFFMSKFRKAHFIEVDHSGGLRVHSSLLNVVLREQRSRGTRR
jgi:CRP-like cAMP-binding protein